MTVMDRAKHTIEIVDGFQQRHEALSVPVAVHKKFGDDRGGQLAALLAYYGFLSLFPALLVLTTILGFVGNERVSRGVLGDALRQFPVVGDQIGKQAAHPLTGSTFGLVVGLLALTYGVLGVAQVAQHALAQVWNVPVADRPGYGARLVRSLLFLGVLALGTVAGPALSGSVTSTGTGWGVRVGLVAGGLLVNTGLFALAFVVLTPKSVTDRRIGPGAVLGGAAWTVLSVVGTALVQHQLRHSQALYGTFAVVLGLLAWLYLAGQIALYSAELNVVLARRLWPRGLRQPPLTPADREVLVDLAQQEERRPGEQVEVDFSSPTGGRTRTEAGR